MSVRREEEEVHHVAEDSFESLLKEQVRAQPHARKDAKKHTWFWISATAKLLTEWKVVFSGYFFADDRGPILWKGYRQRRRHRRHL